LSASSENGNGITWSRYIVAFAFFLTVQAAVLGPVLSRLGDIQTQIDKHEALPHHYGTAEKLSATEVKFTEVETQLRSQKEVSEIRIAALQKQIDELKFEIQKIKDGRK